MNQEIHISKFGDPLFFRTAGIYLGPLGSGKVNYLKNMLDKKQIKHSEIYGHQCSICSYLQTAIKRWLENKEAVIIDGIDLCEESIDKLLDESGYLNNLFVVSNISSEENIPNYIKVNFKIVPYTQIQELN